MQWLLLWSREIRAYSASAHAWNGYNQNKMALVQGARHLLNGGPFALQTASRQLFGNGVKLSHVVSALSIKGNGVLRCYTTEKGNFLSKLLGRAVSPHTDAHSKVLTESLALYELQCE